MSVVWFYTRFIAELIEINELWGYLLGVARKHGGGEYRQRYLEFVAEVTAEMRDNQREITRMRKILDRNV